MKIKEALPILQSISEKERDQLREQNLQSYTYGLRSVESVAILMIALAVAYLTSKDDFNTTTILAKCDTRGKEQ